MALLNDPTRGNVTQAQSIFAQQRARDQQQQLARLQLQNIQSQITQRGRETELLGQPKPASGADELNRVKVDILRRLSPEQQNQFLLKSGVTVNVGEGGPFDINQAIDLIDRVGGNPNVEAKVTISKTGPSVSISPKAPPSAGERTDIAESAASLDALDNLNSLVDPAFVGQFKGRAGQVLDFFGQASPRQSNFLAASAAFKNSIIKQITGAQMSEPEAKRIVKQIPQPTDELVSWRAKLAQSKKNIKMLQRRRREVQKSSGLRVPSARGPAATSPVTNEQKAEVLRRRGFSEEAISAALAESKRIEAGGR